MHDQDRDDQREQRHEELARILDPAGGARSRCGCGYHEWGPVVSSIRYRWERTRRSRRGPVPTARSAAAMTLLSAAGRGGLRVRLRRPCPRRLSSSFFGASFVRWLRRGGFGGGQWLRGRRGGRRAASPARARPPTQSACWSRNTRPTRSVSRSVFMCCPLDLLRIPGDAEADIVALTVAEIARRQAQVGHTRLFPAGAADHMLLAFGGPDRIDRDLRWRRRSQCSSHAPIRRRCRRRRTARARFGGNLPAGAAAAKPSS